LNSSTILSIVVFLAGAFLFLFVSILIGLIVILVGAIMLYFRRKNASRLRSAPSTESSVAPPASAIAAQNESTVVACKSCGTFNDTATAKTCSNCGAPLP
jgi:predicted membrane protein